jgi:hypothetical protein
MIAYAALRRSNTPKSVFERAVDILSLEGHIASLDLPEWASPREPEDYRNAFGMASAFLHHQVNVVRRLIVLVDEVDLATFSPTRSSTWSGLLAMLVLAFPEVRWIFMAMRDSNVGTPDALTDTDWKWFWRNHGPATVIEARGTPLFDGHGLRGWVRERIQREWDRDLNVRGTNPASDRQVVPIRSKVAVVLDDEPEFREFEALMAYTRGFRAHSIETWAEATKLLGYDGSLLKAQRDEVVSPPLVSGRVAPDSRDRFLLSIEDLYVRFPDQLSEGMSDLEKREHALPALSRDSPLCRRFVSVGHEAAGNPEDYARRRQYLRKRRDWESSAVRVRPRPGEQLVYKPAPGLYALWQELGLERVFRQGGTSGIGRGIALDFVWPIQHARARRSWQDERGAARRAGHSSPGLLVEIAQSLLDRATADLGGRLTLTDAVTGAVLATDALELLGGRTPTLSLEALSLKHMFEVRVASQFVGVEYHLAISKRLTDIRVNLATLAIWLHPTRKRTFVLNGEARILTRIVEILERSGQFEEAAMCRTRLATLHRQIEMLSDLKRLAIGRILLWPASLYADWALRSLNHYLIATMVGVSAFILGFAWFGNGALVADAVHMTLRAMFTITLPDPAKDGMHHAVLGYCAAAFGLLNFGLLIAYLYSKLIRK